MFSNLTEKLSNIFNKLTSKGLLTEQDIDNTMREIRISLIEADVSIFVIKELIKNIKEKAVGEKVLNSISPGQTVVKIVYDELVKILGSDKSDLNINTKPPAVIMMVGLQGSGKTTTSAKLALLLKKKYHKNILLVSLDAYRPAAKKQLEILAKQINVESLDYKEEPVSQTLSRALEYGKQSLFDVIILDTAGRLHVDTELMAELEMIEKVSNPCETIMVVDSLTGQDSINIVKQFQDKIKLTGFVLTRIDGDARGGSALSIVHTTGLPIKFVGVGEKLNELQEFFPDRMASRILGKGDIITLVENATSAINTEEAQSMAKKIEKGHFDLNDLLKQIQNLKKIGGLKSILQMLPGVGKLGNVLNNNQSEHIIKKQESIILSMTLKERKDPKIINGSRKKRIASGAGVKVQEVNQLLNHYLEMKNMMKNFSKMDKKSLMRKFSGLMSN